MTKKIFSVGFLSAVGLLVYVLLVALFFSNAEKILGHMPNILSFSLFLLLFVFSATVSATLVLGRPIWLFLSNFKKEALWQLIANLIWIFILLLVVFLVKIIWF